jgi:TonB family protein
MSASLSLARCLRCVVALLLAAAAAAVQAQFGMVPSSLPAESPPSQAESDQAYRIDAARHVYASYPMRVFRGRMPPLLYGVAIVETHLDADGRVLDVQVRRPPAAPEVTPWIVQMIRRAAPFPAPARLGRAVYVDIWLVHKSGNFQLDTLTEGQN